MKKLMSLDLDLEEVKQTNERTTIKLTDENGDWYILSMPLPHNLNFNSKYEIILKELKNND